MLELLIWEAVKLLQMSYMPLGGALDAQKLKAQYFLGHIR